MMENYIRMLNIVQIDMMTMGVYWFQHLCEACKNKLEILLIISIK